MRDLRCGACVHLLARKHRQHNALIVDGGWLMWDVGFGIWDLGYGGCLQILARRYSSTEPPDLCPNCMSPALDRLSANQSIMALLHAVPISYIRSSLKTMAYAYECLH